LKTRRILLRSHFHAASVPLSIFAWKSREIEFRFPCLMIFVWISANVLWSRVSLVECSEPTTTGLTHVVSCLIASHAESLRSFNNQPPAEGSADVGAGQPEFDAVLLIGHRLLCTFHWSLTNQHIRHRGKPTFIIVRITLKEPKTGLAGVILQNSLARSETSMATFSEERMISRRFCR
jgi:hypothetical protein